LGNSAILLAGGSSERFGQDKGLVLLGKKQLVRHVVDAVNGLVEEKVVVVRSEEQKQSYLKVLGSQCAVVVDTEKVQSPLAGAYTGFGAMRGEYSLLLPCDVPFVSREVLSLLLDLCVNKSAVIPRWPNCFIEPLQAAYCTRVALKAAGEALSWQEFTMQAMIDRLRGVRYVSTLVLQQLDPELKTFMNINTPLDLKRAEATLKHMAR
jgi:molybdopterin-guanine dinucleotide biosynthesis protein A